ncbi:MAG: imidazolonepropionase [Cytophagales bacterium]|nr:imidazolonepropionase [Cytophagales bacterium]
MSNKRLIGPFKQLITMRGLSVKGAISDDKLHVLENAAIGVENGLILEVGLFDEMAHNYDEIDEINEGVVGLPGFVDCHTHMVWGGSRARDYSLRMRGETYEKILEEGGGIFDTVEKTRAEEKEILVRNFQEHVFRHLGFGVTTIEVKSGYGLSKESELKMLEVIQEADVKADLIATCLAAHVCPKEFSDKSQYLNYVLEEILPEIKKRDLATRVDAFIEPSAFPAAVARGYLEKAKALGFELTLHADQFKPGGSELAVELGAQSADHLEATDKNGITHLAKSNTVAVALPGASVGLGMQFTPARELLDEGASLAIATDWNPGSAPMGDLITQAALIGIYEKLSTAEVFAGVTFRAANALGLSDRGAIETGKVADFLTFATSDFREILYHQGMMKPTDVWKKGVRIDKSV